LNNCVFIGNLTADPEMRYGQSGTAITKFSIAINERRGEKEETEFLDFVCWDKLAERVAEYARKGRKIGVIASYHLERWEDDHGNKRIRPEFRARNVEFLDKPPQQETTSRAPQSAPPAQRRSSAEDDELDQLPF
jgi:single-strand DNA-binding protein